MTRLHTPTRTLGQLAEELAPLVHDNDGTGRIVSSRSLVGGWLAVEGARVVRPGRNPRATAPVGYGVYLYGTLDPDEGQLGEVVEVRHGDTDRHLGVTRVTVRWQDGETQRYGTATAMYFRLAE